jgi:hypothetical protein
MNFFECGSPQVLPLPCDSSQLSRAPINITTSDCASAGDRAAAADCGVVVGQQAFGHRHRQERDAGFFDEGANVGVGLRIRRALAEDDERPLGFGQQVKGALDRLRSRRLPRCCVDHANKRSGCGLGIESGSQDVTWKIQVHAARASGHGGADGARQADADVFGPIDPVRCLCVRLGRVHLVELLILALLKVDGRPLARSADLDHGKPIRGGGRQGHHSVEKPWSRDGEADARFLRQITADRGRVAGRLLVAEADVANAFGLSQPRQVGYRDSDHTIDGVEAVELHGLDYEVKPVCDWGGVRCVVHDTPAPFYLTVESSCFCGVTAVDPTICFCGVRPVDPTTCLLCRLAIFSLL